MRVVSKSGPLIHLFRRARDRGLLSAIAPLLYALRTRGFWIGEDLVRQVEREETGR